MAVSSDAQAIIDAAGPGALEFIQSSGSNYGSKLTSGEASRLLTGFKPTITPSTVYSAANIAGATNNPAPAPNYADPFGLYDYYMNSADLVAKRDAVAAANAALNTAKQAGRAQQEAIKNLPQALNVIRGEQAVAGEQSALSQQAAAETLLAEQSAYDTLQGVARDKYSIALDERSKLQDLIKQTNGKAGISYADSFETALQKADKYTTEQAKKAKKDAEKDELKKLALSVGISTKGLSSKEIRKKLEKRAKKDSDLEDRMSALKVTAAELDIAKGRKDLAGGSGGDKPLNYTDSEQRVLANELIAEAESKGLYGNYAWEYAASEGGRLGADLATGSPFSNALRAKFGLSSEKP